MKEKQRMLQALMDSDKLPNYYFPTNLRILQYNRCIKQLREAGFEIPTPEKDKDQEGVFWYSLKTPFNEIDFGNCCRIERNNSK